MAKLIVIMGVSGCGKSTIGQKLSKALETDFLEGDDFHPASNVEKMSQGIPLTDEDRSLWLDHILGAVTASPASVVTLACSALTPYVQDRLFSGAERKISWVWLFAPIDTIAARLAQRENHFMPAALLQSQFDALSPPAGAIKVDVSASTESVVETILEKWVSL